MQTQNPHSNQPKLVILNPVKLEQTSKIAAPQTGKMIIDTSQTTADVKIIPSLDIKATRTMMIEQWRNYTPAQIVSIMRKHYTNLKTASVMISHLKSELASLEDPPPDEFLRKLKLSNKEYGSIRADYQQKRQREARSVKIIPNADALVEQALQYLVTSDPNLIYCGLVVCSGWRPIEIIKVGQISLKTDGKHIHPSFWVCMSGFAKRSHSRSEYDKCRDKPLLCPAWLFERGLDIVRKRWPTRHLDNQEVHKKYGKHLQELLQRAFPNLIKPTHVLFRRFYAAYAYIYFKDDFNNAMSTDAFTSFVLGHALLNDTVISYNSLRLQNAGKLNLFEVGKMLKPHIKKEK